MMKPKTDILTTGEIARYCRVTHFTVAKWINAGKLRAYKTPGGHRRVRREDFLAFLRTYRFPIPEELLPTSPRILVVTPEQEGVEMLTHTLRQAGYQVEVASDGYEAGQKLVRFNPDLLVLNLELPHLTGLDLCARIKGDPLTQRIKILALTEPVDRQRGEEALATGADTCLEVPVEPEQLLQVMRSLLPPPQRQSREVSGLERRKTRRVSRAFPVHYTLHIPHQDEPEELIGKGKTIDIGPGGLMLKTALPLQPTHVLNLAVELGRDTPPIQVEGTVQWVKPEQAFTQQVGVRFTRMEEEARTRLVNALFGAFQQG